MRRTRPLAATIGVLVLLAGLVAAPAGAQPTTDVYQASAAGRALRLRLAGTDLSAGTSSATAASDLTANGTGTGLLVLLGTPQGHSPPAFRPAPATRTRLAPLPR